MAARSRLRWSSAEGVSRLAQAMTDAAPGRRPRQPAQRQSIDVFVETSTGVLRRPPGRTVSLALASGAAVLPCCRPAPRKRRPNACGAQTAPGHGASLMKGGRPDLPACH
jgi:hypothetical protein